jgi:cobalamin-dependent methionine synthase I
LIIVGEKLNSSVPKTLEALNKRDEKYIIEMIKAQSECGADYMDVNTALTGEKEMENMLWVMSLVIEHSKCKIMLDSPNPQILIDCIDKAKGRQVIINSITLEDRFNSLIDVAKSHNAEIVCLPISSKKIPETSEERILGAEKIVEKLTQKGIQKKNIYIDVLSEAIATNENAGKVMLDTIKQIKTMDTSIKTICGLSNVSFGLPKRALLNGTFLSMAMAQGLDSAILDITSPTILKTLSASNAILGNDEYCLEYIQYCREN